MTRKNEPSSTVAALKPGEGAVIARVAGQLTTGGGEPADTSAESILASAQIRGRLQDLGFIPGAMVEVRGQSVFGDPIWVEVSGVSVALRLSEAQWLEI